MKDFNSLHLVSTTGHVEVASEFDEERDLKFWTTELATGEETEFYLSEKEVEQLSKHLKDLV